MVGEGDDLAKGDSDGSTGSESSTTDEGETDEGETGDGLSEECYGGEPRGPFWGEFHERGRQLRRASANHRMRPMMLADAALLERRRDLGRAFDVGRH